VDLTGQHWLLFGQFCFQRIDEGAHCMLSMTSVFGRYSLPAWDEERQGRGPRSALWGLIVLRAW
jgi:hypothetical protein